MELAKYEGDVYFGLVDPTNNKFLGYIGPLEADSFVPSREEGEVQEITSKRRDIYGQTIYSETEPGRSVLTIGFREQPSPLLALIFAANLDTINVAGSTVTAEVIEVTELETWIPLAHRNITLTPTPPVVESEPAGTTYVITDDYILNTRLGLIKFIAGGAVTKGSSVSLDYTYGALTGTKFDGETVPEREVRVFFDGKNRVTKKDFSMEYYSVKIAAPTDMFDLLSSELITTELSGTALTPTGKTAPYQVIKQEPEAA